jgi:hypothetical protein
MKSHLDPTFDTEPAKGHQTIARFRIPIRYHSALWVKGDRGSLEYVKVLRSPHTEAPVAFKVSGLVALLFLDGPMLREIFCCSHDKLKLGKLPSAEDLLNGESVGSQWRGR